MKAKTSAHYQREYRKRLRELGLVKKEVWVLPEHAKQLSIIEKSLRIAGSYSVKDNNGEVDMSRPHALWTTQEAYEAISSHDLCKEQSASAELIEGLETSIHIIMHEHGDLPLFLTVSGEQIIVEALLWSTQDVIDTNAFNDAVLRTHKYFPLSTISLDSIDEENDFYHMFGALSASSTLENLILEIETLASNVIQATQAYSEFLTHSKTKAL